MHKLISFLFLFVFFAGGSLQAQTFGDEWIDFNLDYHRVEVNVPAWYRLTQAQLTAAGLAVTQNDPRDIRMFRRGQEIAIFVHGEEDGSFDAEDYIEFYGEPNDAYFEQIQYENPDDIVHISGSLYSDNASYFVALTPGEQGERISKIGDLSGNFPAEKKAYQTYEFHQRWTQSAGPVYYSTAGRPTTGAILSHNVAGTGIVGQTIRPGTSRSWSVSLNNLLDTLPEVDLKVKIVGVTYGTQKIDFYLNTAAAGSQLIDSKTFGGFEVLTYNKKLTETVFKNPNEPLTITYASQNQSVFGMAEIRYARGFDMAGASDLLLELKPNPAGTSRVELENPPAGCRLLDFTNPYDIREVESKIENGKLVANVPNTGTVRHIRAVVIGSRAPLRIGQAMRFKEYDDSADFLIVTHSRLRGPAGGQPDAAQAYADYRESEAGGKHNVTIANVYDLFDRFTGGEPTPVAIRRFADYMLNNGNPKHLFLLGKAMHTGKRYNKSLPGSLSWRFQNLVPSVGRPCSDNELTQGLAGFPARVPAIPTGRLPAMNPQEVINYLNKVKEYESAPADADWRKKFLHLSGGKSSSEVARFAAYVDGFKSIAETEGYLGAEVQSISKKTTENVEYIDVVSQVNEGVGLITFFGHSSAVYNDIEIGRPSEAFRGFNNKGKYPMLLVNGCQSGDIFEDVYSFGEDWMLSADKGAVLFLAHSHLGYEGTLRNYSEIFYETAFGDSLWIDRSVGEVVREGTKRFLAKSSANPITWANAEQFILQGDPAIRLVPAGSPDYAVSAGEISVEKAEGSPGEVLTAGSDEFILKFTVRNKGIVNKSPIRLQVRRIFADGSSEVFSRNVPAIFHHQEFSFTIPNSEAAKLKAGGANTFEVFAEADRNISELSETNNIAVLEYNFPRGSILNVAPLSYGITGKQPTYFVAQNTDSRSDERRYIFQADTSYLFDSPARRDTTFIARLLPQWTTDLSAASGDTTVWFWRVKFADPQSETDTAWATSSFTYVPGSKGGWSQKPFGEQKNNTFSGLTNNPSSRRQEFSTSQTDLDITAYGGGAPDRDNYFIKVNGKIFANAGNCNQESEAEKNAYILASFDQHTGQFYNNKYVQYGCGASALAAIIQQNFYVYTADYIANVRQGDYVIITNSRNVNWTRLSRASYEAIGVDYDTQISGKISGSNAVIILGQKGAPKGSAIVKYASAVGSVSLQTTVNHRLTSGTMLSPFIGPAQDWKSLHHVFDEKNSTSEIAKLEVIGKNYAGQEAVVISDLRGSNYDLSLVEAGSWPYIRLKATFSDPEKSSPAHLRHWRVLYDAVPEGVLLYDSLSYRESTVLTVTEGDTVRLGFYFMNVSGTDFPRKITVRYTVTNQIIGNTRIFYDTIPAVKAGQFVRFETKFNSLDYRGLNSLQIYVNPKNQAEQIYENNILQAKFDVRPDEVSPVLDVAVDGRFITDGEIVSPEPVITIAVRDENKSLPLIDPALVEILLRKCEDCPFEAVDLRNNPKISARTKENNTMEVEYRPGLLEDGLYTLRVQARDVSGNSSGLEPFGVNFRIINETSVSNFYPYPNPVSDRMQFVFTLTGKIPDDLRVRILTITGKTVRTISKEELGALRIGQNISEFVWDGTDEFGDRLANGVYLYKVDLRDAGEVKKFATSADGLFKDGYGKIYLMK